MARIGFCVRNDLAEAGHFHGVVSFAVAFVTWLSKEIISIPFCGALTGTTETGEAADDGGIPVVNFIVIANDFRTNL